MAGARKFDIKLLVTRCKNQLMEYRSLLSVVLHMTLVVVANYIAFWLRFDGNIPAEEAVHAWKLLPLLLGIRLITFVPFGLYRGLWRYTGLWDLRNIILAVLASSVAFFGLVRWVFVVEFYPRSVFIIDALILIIFMGGLRMVRRLHQELPSRHPMRRVLIYGAGDAGEMIVRDMRNHVGFYKYNPVGFLDDDPCKVGQRIHGVPVLGGREHLRDIVVRSRAQEVILAIPAARQSIFREVVKALEPLNVVIKTVPNLREIKNGQIQLRHTRNISSEDLLDRIPVRMDVEPIRDLIRGKRILVTGAAGSIGSELCRQIASYEPEILILLDKSEGGIFAIDTELGQKFPQLKKSAALVDIKHTSPLREIFTHYAPQIVIHAAAYKHVPMMEFHPEEAVLNNVIGTSRLAHVAIEHKVEKFMLISTDKAVNPTNVMGATKRVAEMFIDALECNVCYADTIFSAVRFGNVLGSSGSVLPLFRKQIEDGGPVTVTHPDITRFFMTIPEAVQLVLRAVSLAEGGEIFVLDMGEPIKLVDMARNLIRSSGLIPDKDIQIKFVGLRPGEKLHEELIGPGESVQTTGAEKILKIRPTVHIALATLLDQIVELEKLSIQGTSKALLEILYAVVPNFRPASLNPDEYQRIGLETAVHVDGVSMATCLGASIQAKGFNPQVNDVGSVFSLDLPVGSAIGPLSQRKILIVDDERQNLELLCATLQAVGWDVITASNGRDALESVKSNRPDAIVLDMVMPVMDGFELARSLKSDPDYSGIPIIAATSLLTRADRKRCLAAGCDDYVAKPFTVGQLHQRLQCLME
jgi:FlaA1/EpsC-like NDP-sugar epimerase